VLDTEFELNPKETDPLVTIDGKKFGLLLPQWEDYNGLGRRARVADLLELGRAVEESGLDSVWVVDHFLSVPMVDEANFDYELPPEMDGVRIGYWECWTLASALAATTRRIEIGTLVSNTGYRNPALLAQMVNTVDDLSDGRVILGLGAGDYPAEHEAFGFPFERRVGRFEESLQIIRPLLRGERVTFEGEFYRTRDAELRPRAPRAEGPPVLIGLLRGGPRMQRLVAQYADQWNCWMAENTQIDLYREAYASIVEACEKHGRDPRTLEKNAAIGVLLPGGMPEIEDINPISGSVAEIQDVLGSLLEEDIGHFAVTLEPATLEGVQRFAELLAGLR
jgi:alkanesulfonate monooxygenase SsuD/methylene tetrahydromethanopterin reductase-like flavin-dependent oxidoreductase (luciferase family)